MKHIILSIAALTIALTASAQQTKNHKWEKERVPIEELVSDLSPTQKTRIDVVTRRSKKIIDEYRQELQAVRDSVRLYMNMPGDQTAIIFPLYDRQSRLYNAINKEYYRSKLAIDEVLTTEQYNALKKKIEEDKAKRHHKKKQSDNK